MKILLIADPQRATELQNKLSGATVPITIDLYNTLNLEQKAQMIQDYDLIIDTTFDEYPARLANYTSLLNQHQTLLLASVKHSLAQAILDLPQPRPINFQLAGFNALPTFIDRPLWEICFWQHTNRDAFQQLFQTLGIAYRTVEDRAGMVMPRILCMIINEAYFMLQEQGASKKHIDQAMRLGVNYPNGPFEWAKKIGLKHIYQTLIALQKENGSERYPISQLLKKEYAQENAQAI